MGDLTTPTPPEHVNVGRLVKHGSLAMLAFGTSSVVLAFAPTADDAFATPKAAAFAIVAATLVFASPLGRVGRLILVSGGLAIVAIGALFGGETAVGRPYYRHGIITIWCFAAVLLASRSVVRSDVAEELWRWLSLPLTLVVAYASLQYVGLDYYRWSNSNAVASTLGNENSLACCLLMIAGYGAFLSPKDRGSQFLIIVAFFVVGLTGSRMGLVAGLALSILSLFATGRRILGLLAVATVASGAIVLGTIGSPQVAAEGDASVVSSHAQFSDGARIEIWRLSIDIMRSHWLIGTGPDGFANEATNLMDSSYPHLSAIRGGGAIVLDNPHNFVLEAVAFFGVAGAAGLGLFGAWLGFALVKAGRAAMPGMAGVLPALMFGSVNPLGLGEIALAALFIGTSVARVSVATRFARVSAEAKPRAVPLPGWLGVFIRRRWVRADPQGASVQGAGRPLSRVAFPVPSHSVKSDNGGGWGEGGVREEGTRNRARGKIREALREDGGVAGRIDELVARLLDE